MDPVAVAQGLLQAAMIIKKAHDDTKELYEQINEYLITVELIETCIRPITEKKPEDIPQGTRTVMGALQGCMNAFSETLARLKAKKPNVFGMFKSKTYLDELAVHHEKLHKFANLLNLEQTVRTQDTVSGMAKGGGGSAGRQANISATTMLPNNSGRTFWLKQMGPDCFECTWEKFVSALNTELGEQDEHDLDTLREELDENQDGSISLYEFSQFCEHKGLYEAYEELTSPNMTLLGWGTGNAGELGVGGDLKDVTDTPVPVGNLPNDEIVQCALGNQYSLILYKSGEVYSSGLAGWGQLGVGDTSTLPRNEKNYACLKSFQLVDNLQGKHMTMLAAGFSFVLGLTKDQEVYSWGCNTNGQVGQGKEVFDEKDRLRIPMKVPALTGKKVSQIEAGSYLAAVLTEEGDVYVWGYNEILGIGTPDEVQKKYEEARTIQSKDDAKRPLIVTPTLNEFFHGKDICGISCGQWHCTCVTTRGEVYSFGSGLNGRLGHGKLYDDTNRRCYVPKLVEFPEKDVKIIQVACGSFHTVCLSEAGDLYTFGYNAEGQCGDAVEKEYWTPHLCSSMKNVKRMGAAERMTACLNDKGEVFVFGKGPNLTVGEVIKNPTPLRSLNKDFNVKSIYCGTYHAFAIAQPRNKKRGEAGTTASTDPMVKKLLYQLMERCDDCVFRVGELSAQAKAVSGAGGGGTGTDLAGVNTDQINAAIDKQLETIKKEVVKELTDKVNSVAADAKKGGGCELM